MEETLSGINKELKKQRKIIQSTNGQMNWTLKETVLTIINPWKIFNILSYWKNPNQNHNEIPDEAISHASKILELKNTMNKMKM